MTIWRLSTNDDLPLGVHPLKHEMEGGIYRDWDWTSGAYHIIIRAANEQRARALAADEEGKHWLDSELTLCDEIDPDGDEAIILVDWQGE